jgi:hypothetical protein
MHSIEITNLILFQNLFPDCQNEQNVSIILDGVESELKFKPDNKGSKVSFIPDIQFTLSPQTHQKITYHKTFPSINFSIILFIATFQFNYDDERF